MAVDMIARMMAMGNGGGSGDAYTKAQTDALLDGKADLENGKVPASQLPSYVDDVVEYASTSSFPETGESGKIYISTDTNKTYRWGGSAYVEISESLALGETASAAYAGNKGKANADAIAAIKDGTNIDSFADVETALAVKLNISDVDAAISSTSTNPVQNRVIQAPLARLTESVESLSGIARAETFTTVANQYVYTNQSFTVPAGKIAIFTASVFYNASKPNALKVGKNADPEATDEDATLWFHEVGEVSLGTLSVSGITQKRGTDITYYIHAKYAAAGTNAVSLYYRII